MVKPQKPHTRKRPQKPGWKTKNNPPKKNKKHQKNSPPELNHDLKGTKTSLWCLGVLHQSIDFVMGAHIATSLELQNIKRMCNWWPMLTVTVKIPTMLSPFCMHSQQLWNLSHLPNRIVAQPANSHRVAGWSSAVPGLGPTKSGLPRLPCCLVTFAWFAQKGKFCFRWRLSATEKTSSKAPHRTSTWISWISKVNRSKVISCQHLDENADNPTAT